MYIGPRIPSSEDVGISAFHQNILLQENEIILNNSSHMNDDSVRSPSNNNNDIFKKNPTNIVKNASKNNINEKENVKQTAKAKKFITFKNTIKLIEDRIVKKGVSFFGEINKIKLVRLAIEKLKKSSIYFQVNNLKKIHYHIIGDLANENKEIEQAALEKFENAHDSRGSLFFYQFKRFWKKVPIIYPNGKMKMLWDFLMFVLIVLNMWLFSLDLFFEPAFLRTLFFTFYLNINAGLFFVDILFKFKTSIYEHGVLTKKNKNIARNYMKTCFYCDILSLFFLVSYSTLLQNTIFKWLIMIFILEFKNLRRIVENFENFIDFGDLYELIFLMFKIMCVAHVYACLWHYIAYKYENNEVNWISALDLASSNWDTRYLYSFYWALTTMVTVGYGDITPKNSLETLFCSFAIMTGSLVFGYCLNRVGTLLTNYDERDKELKQNIKIMDNYMRNHNINADLKGRTIKYLEFAWKLEKSNFEKEESLMEKLPESLKKEILFEANQKSLFQFPILKNNFNEEFLNKLSSAINTMNFSPKEIIYSKNDYEIDNPSIFLIVEGKVDVLVGGRILRSLNKNKTFGEREFFLNIPYEETIISSTFATVYKIPRLLFVDILRKIPEQYEVFCNIKDKIIYYNDPSNLYSPCYSCNADKHNVYECNLVNYNKRKRLILQRLNYSKLQERRPFAHIRSKYDALNNFRINKTNAIKLRFNESSMKTYKRATLKDSLIEDENNSMNEKLSSEMTSRSLNTWRDLYHGEENDLLVEPPRFFSLIIESKNEVSSEEEDKDSDKNRRRSSVYNLKNLCLFNNQQDSVEEEANKKIFNKHASKNYDEKKENSDEASKKIIEISKCGSKANIERGSNNEKTKNEKAPGILNLLGFQQSGNKNNEDSDLLSPKIKEKGSSKFLFVEEEKSFDANSKNSDLLKKNLSRFSSKFSQNEIEKNFDNDSLDLKNILKTFKQQTTLEKTLNEMQPRKNSKKKSTMKQIINDEKANQNKKNDKNIDKKNKKSSILNITGKSLDELPRLKWEKVPGNLFDYEFEIFKNLQNYFKEGNVVNAGKKKKGKGGRFSSFSASPRNSQRGRASKLKRIYKGLKKLEGT